MFFRVNSGQKYYKKSVGFEPTLENPNGFPVL